MCFKINIFVHQMLLITRFIFIVFLTLFFTSGIIAQVDSNVIPAKDSALQKDSVLKKDSLAAGKDTLLNIIPADTNISLTPSARDSIKTTITNDLRTDPPLATHYTGKDTLFYVLVILLLIFALLRQAFPKYFTDLFRLFFRTTLKQRQIREQLIQTPLPSLLMNGFFVITGALYIDFLLNRYGLAPVDNFWLLFLYCAIGLSLIYFVKFLGLKISGWLFNMEEAADSYIFVVFVVNKVIGIFLLPFLVALAFMQGPGYTVAWVLSWVGVAGLLIYRLILTYAAIRNQVRVNPFHFFLYLCAFEIAPLLLIYKGLLEILKQTT
jgi:hypothetical protein